MIINNEQLRRIQNSLPANEYKSVNACCIVVRNTKVVSMIQDHIGQNSTKNAGMPLINPLTRITLATIKTSCYVGFSRFGSRMAHS